MKGTNSTFLLKKKKKGTIQALILSMVKISVQSKVTLSLKSVWMESEYWPLQLWDISWKNDQSHFKDILFFIQKYTFSF